MYNIEVEGDHCYRVGQQGLLVHNASIPTKAPPAGMDYMCGSLSGSGSLDRDKPTALNSNIKGGVPAGYEGHHLIGVVEAQNSQIMVWAAKLGYDINRQNNGAAYPSYGNTTFPTLMDGQKEACSKKLPLHRGRHADARYTFCVKKYLTALEADYRAGVVTDCDLCAEIKKIENKIRKALKAHKIWLNSKDPWTTAAGLSCSPATDKTPNCPP